MSFANKRVLITGGAGGLGSETAKKFMSEGATVILLDKDEGALNEIKTALPKIQTVAADLLNWDQTRAAVKTIGRVDHLVNNAGVNRREEFMSVKPESIDFIFGVNFKAIVNVSQAVAEEMLSSGKGGTIVNISSFAANSVLPAISMYSCSKAAVSMLTKNMAVELGPTIRVNCICPTYMITPLTTEYIKQNPERFEGMLNRAPIKRFLTPAEAADSIMFLSSPASAMITGVSLDVDGGYCAV